MTIKTPTTTEQTSNAQLTVHSIYVKSSVFEAAALTPELIKNAQQSTIDFQAQANFSERGKDQYEAVLSLHFTAKHEGSLLWQIKIQQAGLYTLQGVEEDERKQVINGFCMNQLYPYACAAINHLVVQGGFPAVSLLPMDFNRIYQEQLAKEQEQAPLEKHIEGVH